MLRLFLKRGRGSISVFVILILVPVVFLMGFLVDLSRIKFCGNQAVMAADNYGETILTDYDNLLKELYGLFALTQNKEGKEALDRLDAYVKEYSLTSFNPNESRISFSHLQDFTQTKAYNGWMPYQNAVVELSAEPVAGASLSEPEVFNTQIGDFMKFRIIQTVGGSEEEQNGFLKAIESVQNMQKDTEAVEKRAEVAKKAAEVLKLAQDYYARLEAIYQYPEYIREINDRYGEGTGIMSGTIAAYYPPYRDYVLADKEAMEAALQHRAEIEAAEREKENLPEESDSITNGEEEGEGTEESEEEQEEDTLSEEEEELCRIHDAYFAAEVHPQDTEENLDTVFKRAYEMVKVLFDRSGTLYADGNLIYDSDGKTQTVVKFENFDKKVSELKSLGNKIYDKMDDLATLRKELDEILQDERVSEELKKGIEEEFTEVDNLFDAGGYYSADNYLELAYSFDTHGNVTQNQRYKDQAMDMYNSMEQVRDECLEDHLSVGELSDFEPKLDENQWWNFISEPYYQKLYNQLNESFGNLSDNSSMAKQKQDESDSLLDNVGKKLDEDKNDIKTRDIPASFGMGDADSSSEFDITNMIGKAGKSFNSFSLSDVGNRLLTKLYLTQYDFGMFTSRVTNVKTDEENGGEEGEKEEKTEESLTGYPMAPNINYLYQAEIEYLLGGHNSSNENLNEARNKILVFRSAMNLASTYTIDEINNLIKAVAKMASAVNPLLGLVVSGSLRLAVAGVETYADWELLKSGESAVVFKRDKNDLSVLALSGELADGLTGLLGERIERTGESNEFSLDYEQYLLIMMVFMTRSELLSQRSADLITLNVNAVRRGIGLQVENELEELNFRMEDTVTAVDVTCAVQLDMVVMPKGFAQKTVGDSTYQEIERFEDNTYKFTVTRGY